MRWSLGMEIVLLPHECLYSALSRWRLEDQDFKLILSYLVNSRPARNLAGRAEKGRKKKKVVLSIYLCIWNPSGYSFEHTFCLEWESNAILVKLNEIQDCVWFLWLIKTAGWRSQGCLGRNLGNSLACWLYLVSTVSLLLLGQWYWNLNTWNLSLHFHQNYGFSGCTLHRWVTFHSMV